ncbi:MAG TPA: prepilin-type N-terminal cleavage/methylation domain-containing protein [Chthoniobacteraceae bacterium]|nr:prepilin-type N-terminal cleavage/methylation domain-containing protein [Chthoniobacteraceae bacterium]
MRTARALKQAARAGFTLLEIMLAVAVLGLVGITIHRFVQGTLQAVAQSTQLADEERQLDAVGDFLRYQLQHLPVRAGAISGEPHRFDEISGDEVRWVATAGSGLLTRYAGGEYNVALTTRKRTDGDGFELGLQRQDIEGRHDADWLPLMPKVHAFEVRYFDPRLQNWVERWNDQTARPSVVRMQLWPNAEADPFEVTIPVPYISVAAQLPQFNFNRGQRRRRSRANQQRGENAGERRGRGPSGPAADQRANRNGSDRRPPGNRPPEGAPPR